MGWRGWAWEHHMKGGGGGGGGSYVYRMVLLFLAVMCATHYAWAYHVGGFDMSIVCWTPIGNNLGGGGVCAGTHILALAWVPKVDCSGFAFETH